jgi:hypothetical protein
MMTTKIVIKIKKYCIGSIYLLALQKWAKQNDLFIAKTGYDSGRPVRSTKPERKQPIDAITKSHFETILGCELPEVIIHTGGQNQEILRASGATALTRGKDIFVREEIYNNISSLTEATLIHELTHVTQYKNQAKFDSKENIEKAEGEAFGNEIYAYPDQNPNYYAKIGGKLFL